jgi:hypothetical protein
MPSIRTWHAYLGILLAPSVLFFCLTGALQIFSLHEAHGSYVPPPLIEKLAGVHKDQVFAQKEHEAPNAEPEAKEGPPGPPEAEERAALDTTLLKWFFLFVALGLATSTCLGLWIGLTHVLRKRTGWFLLAIGIILPVGLVVF